MQAYKNYENFYLSYAGKKWPILLDYVSCKTHCLFVLDCSRREDNINSSMVDIKLDIDVSQGFFDKTKTFCFIIHDYLTKYLPLSEIITNFS